MHVNPRIFREYDIRGLVDQELTGPLAFHLGRAVGTQLRQKNLSTVTVGRDCRESGVWLQEALTQGLLACGLTVLDIGVVPTPVQYHSMHYFNADGGVQITGSHNPPAYNGFKISIAGVTLHGAQILALKAQIENENYVTDQGVTCQVNALLPYGQELLENLRLGPKPLKIVVDAGNGTAGPVAPEIYRALGCEVIELYCDMDASFPNHHPDPTIEENLRGLQRAVRAHGADVGLAFDGDADRLGVIDERGQILWGDRLLIVLARAVLARKSGATIVAEAKCSSTLFEDVAARGGKAVMAKAGHSLIKATMKETGAALAGEMSGHIFYQDRYYGFDDGIYAGGRLLEILSRAQKPLSQLLTDVPKTFFTPELRRPCPEESKFALVQKAQAHFRQKHKTIEVDGVRILFDDGWGLIRASNTQPLLVLRFEASSAPRLAQIRAYVESELKNLEKNEAAKKDQ